MTQKEIRIPHLMPEITIGLDQPVIDMVEYLAEALEFPVNFVIQNVLIDFWAECSVQKELEIPRLLLHFMKTGDGDIITGEALFDTLVVIYKQEIERASQPEVSEGLIESQNAIMEKYLESLPPASRAKLEDDIEKSKKWLEERTCQ